MDVAARAPASPEAALSYFTSLFELEPIRVFETGGSPATVVQGRSADGRDLVLKYLLEPREAVDGHDVQALVLKVRQIELVRSRSQGLGAWYVPVLRAERGPDWAAYLMPYYDGVDLAEPLRRGSMDDFFTALGDVLETMIEGGYRTECLPAPPGEIVRTHLARVAGRAWILERCLPPDLVDGDEVLINGHACPPLRGLLRRVEADANLLGSVDARSLWFPAHGDLNVRNVLLGRATGTRPTPFALIDPRGMERSWDPVYDVAKILFSLTVWDRAMRHGFELEREAAGRHAAYRWAVRDAPDGPAYAAAVARLLDAVAELPAFAAVAAREPAWRDRVLLAHAFHLIAEAACRLSDAHHRYGGSLPPGDRDLAVGHFLAGTALLTDALRQLEARGSIDPVDHLALLPRGR